MLPTSLRLVYALNAATFQVSSLALLSIVNTRVNIPAEYLPAYGAISFLPYSLRPIFAWISSLLLNYKRTTGKNRDRHDRLLFPVFMLASLSFVGTTFIPSGGIILCFFWGFVRGIAGAWADFLVGMAVIEFSKLQSHLSPSPVENKFGGTYEHTVSITTAQSSTAKNIGSFVASIATFVFFAKNRDLEETVANTLLLGTAGVFVLASLVSLKYQFHIGNLTANVDIDRPASTHRHDTIDGNEGHPNDTTMASADNNVDYIDSSFQQPTSSIEVETILDGSSERNTAHSPFVSRENGDVSENTIMQRQKIVEVSTLVTFQILLAVSALQKPLVAISSKTVWVSMVVLLALALVFAISLGYRYERQQSTLSLIPSSEKSDEKRRSQRHRLPHRQLNLYFLLRYSMPIASFLIYSYLYTVFESEPMFLQLLSVLKTAIGSVATFCYEKFLSPYCHSGWPLIGLIATLDIVMGLVALLDVWVIRAVKEKEVNGEYTIDNRLRCLVLVVGLTKYFFAELDYMPALVLSTTNVYSDDDREYKYDNALQTMPQEVEDPMDGRVEERTSLSEDFHNPGVSSLCIESYNDEEDEIDILSEKLSRPEASVISAGMQYASFLSCIDFGAQIGDWITIPIIASLGITRENHWDQLDRLVIICSILRMFRVAFLWLISPSTYPNQDGNNANNIS